MPEVAIEQLEVLRRQAARPAARNLRIANLPQPLVRLVQVDRIVVPVVVRVAEGAGGGGKDRPAERSESSAAHRAGRLRDPGRASAAAGTSAGSRSST